MSRRFDTRTNVFNQKGRINQIEYAIRAIKNSGPSLAISFPGGIAVATEKPKTSKLMVSKPRGDKIHKVDEHLYCVVSGLTADANYLLEYLRTESQRYFSKFEEEIPIEQLVERVCDLKQAYTQSGGMRPFGSSFIFLGKDYQNGFQIWSSDPSGNMFSWKAIAQGSNEENANNFLKEEFKPDLSEQQALHLVVKGLMQTLDTSNPEVERIEVAVVREPGQTTEGPCRVDFNLLTGQRIAEIVEKINQEISEEN